MRSPVPRGDRGKAGRLDAAGGGGPFRALGWSSKDAVGFILGAFATIAVVVNVLFMQAGSPPAPIFKGGLVPAKPAAATNAAIGVISKSAPAPAPAAVPRARPAELAPGKIVPPSEPPLAKTAPPPVPRAPGEIITDVQRELVRRGFYDSAVDGLYGPKTDSAIREFEQAAGLKPSLELNEALLAAITRASAKLSKTPASAASSGRPAAVRNDPVAERPAPSKRVLALQRALAEYGYGQIKPTGIVDSETQAAIEKFERERRLPITGQASDRVTRELAAMTGRPLE